MNDVALSTRPLTFVFALNGGAMSYIPDSDEVVVGYHSNFTPFVLSEDPAATPNFTPSVQQTKSWFYAAAGTGEVQFPLLGGRTYFVSTGGTAALVCLLLRPG